MKNNTEKSLKSQNLKWLVGLASGQNASLFTPVQKTLVCSMVLLPARPCGAGAVSRS